MGLLSERASFIALAVLVVTILRKRIAPRLPKRLAELRALPANQQPLFKRRYIQIPGPEPLWLYYHTWRPEGKPRGVVFIAHGLGEHILRYTWVAEFLTAKGLVVMGVDHAGHGQSEGARLPYFPEDTKFHSDNLLAFVDLRLAEDFGPDAATMPKFLLGHSMGGCIAITAGRAPGRRWSGVVLSAPLCGNNVEEDLPAPLHAPIRQVVEVLAAVIPTVPIVPPFEGGALTADEQMYMQYLQDPLNHKGGVSLAVARGTNRGVQENWAHCKDFVSPVLVVHGDKDKIVPIAPAKRWLEACGSQDKYFEVFEGANHEVFNEVEEIRTRAVKFVTDWIVQRI